VADLVTAYLNTAVVAVGGLGHGQALDGVEEQAHVLGQGRLLVLQRQTLATGPSRDERQRMGRTSFGPARAFTVEGDEVGLGLAQGGHPRGKAFGKAARGQGIHHVVECVMRGNAMGKRQESAQEVQLARAPALDLHERFSPAIVPHRTRGRISVNG
jgi:hypothetical protein